MKIQSLETLVKVARVAQQTGALSLEDAVVVLEAVKDAEETIMSAQKPQVGTIEEKENKK